MHELECLGAGGCLQVAYELVRPPGWQGQSPKQRAEGKGRNTSRRMRGPNTNLAAGQGKPCAESIQEKQNFILMGLEMLPFSNDFHPPQKATLINTQS